MDVALTCCVLCFVLRMVLLVLLLVLLLLLQPKPLNHVKGHICQICGDDVGLTTEGELFVACNECAFPVCRPCYDYERNDGNQSCPQCKTRYKRHKGMCIVYLLPAVVLAL
jgi:hypothetical protein